MNDILRAKLSNGKECDDETTPEISSISYSGTLHLIFLVLVCVRVPFSGNESFPPQLSLESESSALCAACAQFHAICCRSKHTEKQIGEEYDVLESQHPIVPTTASWEHSKTLVGCNWWDWHKMCPNF
jgi:hypothetical protein